MQEDDQTQGTVSRRRRLFRALAEPRNLLCLAAALVSGAMLWTAFPPLDRSDSAWFALVPLILLVRHAKPRAAFGWAWLAGMAFWLPSLTWLWQLIGNGGPWALVVLGHGALAAYCALYFGLYGLAAATLWQVVVRHAWRGWRLLAVVVAEPVLWAGSEYLRGTLLSGFPWNALAVSQAGNAALIQPAAWGGVALVSALLFGVSAGVASMMERVAQPLFDRGGERPRFDPWRSAEGILPLLILAACWMGGLERVRARTRSQAAQDEWRVVLVQPDTPSIFEITDEVVLEQRRILLDLTTYAAAACPDLVIWPETAVQGVMPWHADVMALASNAAHAAGAPLLTGTVEAESIERAGQKPGARFYNAAWLFDTNGTANGRYRKQHLVPFGEFVPGDRWLPILERLSPVGFSCTPGRESTVLRVRGRGGRTSGALAFSPLICFEDVFAGLSRRAVRRGARLLVNITNDAWFDGSSESEQHLRQSIFRTVENGVPMVRAANTGVSCLIDASGRVSRFDAGPGGATGFMPASVRIPPTPQSATLYNRLGDWVLGIPAAICVLGLAMAGWCRGRARCVK
jgi:apolipoprotein N-acyltransferase